MPRHKRTHADIDEPSVDAAAPALYFDLLPPELRVRIATFMAPSYYVMLASLNILPLVDAAESADMPKIKRRVAYDVHLIDSMQWWCKHGGQSIVKLLLAYTDGLFDSIPHDIRHLLCSLLHTAFPSLFWNDLRTFARKMVENDNVNVLDVLAPFFDQDIIDMLLVAACLQGASRCFRHLIGAGANPNGTSYQHSPLYWCVETFRINMIHELLKAGANPSIGHPTHSSITPLHKICSTAPIRYESNWHQEVIVIAQTLIKYGAVVDGHGDGSYTPLCIATRNNDDIMVRLLLECGADARSPQARTFAEQLGYTNIIEILNEFTR